VSAQRPAAVDDALWLSHDEVRIHRTGRRPQRGCAQSLVGQTFQNSFRRTFSDIP
jgi:hypothetical protein